MWDLDLVRSFSARPIAESIVKNHGVRHFGMALKLPILDRGLSQGRS